MKKISIIIAAAIVLSLAIGGNGLASSSPTPTSTPTSDATVTFEKGELKFIKTPSLAFGTHAIPASPASYKAENSSSIVLTISDARGTNSGWEVQASLTDFVNATKSITNTEIRLKSASVSAESGTTGTAPTTSDITLTSNGGDVKVFEAETGSGAGTWSVTWTNDNTELHLNAVSGIEAIQYTATLHWKLVSAV